MGIGSNLMVKMREQELEEENYHNIIEEAAHYIINERMSRKEAFAHAKNLHEKRQDKNNYVAVDEETGEIEYLQSELKEPVFEKTKQIKAVISELFAEFY